MPLAGNAPPPLPYALHWFRRDLRVVGNIGLRQAWRDFQGRVLGLFCFDSEFLARPDFSANRFAFFLETLRALRDELRSLGGDLLVVDSRPQSAFRGVFARLQERSLPLPRAVSFHRDYEPFARHRDESMSEMLISEFGVEVRTERDHLLIEPSELTRNDGGFYQVFTPFSRRWFDRLSSRSIQDRIAVQHEALKAMAARKRSSKDSTTFTLTWPDLFAGLLPFDDALDSFVEKNRLRTTVAIPAAGTAEAIRRASQFHAERLQRYADDRDLPAAPGTSQMSIYLKNGSITTAQLFALCGLQHCRPDKAKPPSGSAVFAKELAWREFYYHVLYHRPDVETTAFLERYRNLPWENRDDYFRAWCEGRTGYPIVDAGMRQLNATGWMHNRVRMIVASFLTKDLLVDYRWGERYFMEKLLDGDLAPNNGGWQWAASTGCDPQPYFRIFNPKLQGEKFDPKGEYVRRWVPELRDVPTKEIHMPHNSPASRDYVRPIVDHAAQKPKALALFQRS